MAFRRGQWVMCKQGVAIVVGAGSGGQCALHLIDKNGETVMEFDKTLQRPADKVVVAHESELTEASVNDIPASRRPGQ